MKRIKILTVIVLTSLLISLMLIPVSAWGEELTVSEDLSYVEHNGEKYIRVSSNEIFAVHAAEHTENISFENDEDEVSYAEAFFDKNTVELWISYNKGGSNSYYYINESLISDLDLLLKNGGEKFRIEFYSSTVNMTKAQLFGKELSLAGHELDRYGYTGEVLFYAFDGSISISSGYIVSDQNGSFYYVDYIKSSDGSGAEIHEQKNVKLWQITDKALLSELKDALNDEYPDGDIYYDEDIGIGVGIVLLVIILGVIPLAGAILAFIISFKCNKQYKLRMRIISALCLSAVLITVITVIICLAIAI